MATASFIRLNRPLKFLFADFMGVIIDYIKNFTK